MVPFYVYELVDPRDQSVFYVGKGKGRRLLNHEEEARRGVHSRKCDRIRQIWASGHTVERRIVRRFALEAEAYDYEVAHIAAIGLRNLTNVLAGGGGIGPPQSAPPLWTVEKFRVTAKLLARALRFAHEGNRILIASHDVTDLLQVVLRKAVGCLGMEKVAAELKPHGVLLTR